MKHTFKLVVALLLSALTLPSWAMARRPCSDPAVFQSAAVNALVLPYRVDLPPSLEMTTEPAQAVSLQAASQQVSALVHLQLLMGMLKYGSIGAVDLVASSARDVCDVDEVLFTVSRPGGGQGSLQKGQAVLALWGRLFEQGGELYLQSYLRFARQGPTGLVQEELALDLPGLSLRASLPAQALAFAPRRISRAELARVNRAFREAMLVRERPDAEAPGKPFASAPGQSFPYGVAETRGDWIRLLPMRSGLPAGWVRARSQSDEAWALARWLPELEVAEAVAGWLRLQVGGLSAAEREAMRASLLASLKRYEEAVPAALAPDAWALLVALRGHLAWTAGQRSEAAVFFERSRARMPNLGAARNLAAMAQLAEAPLDAAASSRFSSQLLGALAVAPTDALVRANLVALYRLYAERPELSPFTKPELLARREVLNPSR